MQMSFEFSPREPHTVRSEAHHPHEAAYQTDTNDYHHMPASEKQLRYARQLAGRLHRSLPDAATRDRRSLSNWIEAHQPAARARNAFSAYPSSKQVAFAERLARAKRRSVPDACFRDRTLMSRWIDNNR